MVGARLIAPDRLSLIVSSSNRNQSVPRLREAEVEVRIQVVVDVHPFLKRGQECLDKVSESQMSFPTHCYRATDIGSYYQSLVNPTCKRKPLEIVVTRGIK